MNTRHESRHRIDIHNYRSRMKQINDQIQRELSSENRFDYISNQNLENLTTVSNSFLQQVREDIKEKIQRTILQFI
ncbi:hypothetical protein [Nitrosopumilus ureiphilus]|uniref:hypothetical protein n=1 Tax=Nitrosopumilus ureiphilus TaxID=1470067 RepID=UPI0015CB96F8|nr:hypothetical protein [Nitrosopumilus ureiphilus]